MFQTVFIIWSYLLSLSAYVNPKINQKAVLLDINRNTGGLLFLNIIFFYIILLVLLNHLRKPSKLRKNSYISTITPNISIVRASFIHIHCKTDLFMTSDKQKIYPFKTSSLLLKRILIKTDFKLRWYHKSYTQLFKKLISLQWQWTIKNAIWGLIFVFTVK